MRGQSRGGLSGEAEKLAREPLTPRQTQVLDFIRHCIEERGYPPTLREIGRHMLIRSTNGVNDHLKALEKKGYLKREDLKSRALRPVFPAVPSPAGRPSGRAPEAETHLRAPVISVPVLGQVAAGQPVFAAESVETTIQIDPSLLGASRAGLAAGALERGALFALRIRGDSMIEDGICEGDYVFVKRQPTAREGEIVVALIDDETTVKRYHHEGQRIRLQPANATMAPIYIDANSGRDVSILGVVVGLWRRLN